MVARIRSGGPAGTAALSAASCFARNAPRALSLSVDCSGGCVSIFDVCLSLMIRHKKNRKPPIETRKKRRFVLLTGVPYGCGREDARPCWGGSTANAKGPPWTAGLRPLYGEV